MFHACAVRFDVMSNLKNFLDFRLPIACPLDDRESRVPLLHAQNCAVLQFRISTPWA